PNMCGLVALGATLDLLLKMDIAAVGRRILEITDLCCRRLQELGAKLFSSRDDAAHNSGIVTFELPGCDSMAVRKHGFTRDVALEKSGGKLRISPHDYINDEDIEKLLETLAEAKQLCKRA